MAKEITHIFIKSFNDKEVQCHVVEDTSLCVFKEDFMFGGVTLFAGYELFEGKALTLEMEVTPGCMSIKCFEVDKSKTEQLLDYFLYKVKLKWMELMDY